MIVVWTPTVRPGLDVACESIARQCVLRENVYWIVGDDLKRPSATYKRGPTAPDQIFWPADLTDREYSLDAGNNRALQIARDLDADLFISMMDYTWIDVDGVRRFAEMAHRHPHALLTGIAHTMADPDASLVVDPEGDYTIFAEPYTGKPQQIGWEDCRLDRKWRLGDHEQRIEPTRWEFNWAAIPREALHDERLRFDERYDQFHSHDNIDFATRASVLGYEVWIDYDNVALRLPRRTYWPEEQRFKSAEHAGMSFFYDQPRRDVLELRDTPWIDGPGFYQEIQCRNLELPEDLGELLAHWRSHMVPGAVLRIALLPDAPHSRSRLQMTLLDAGFSRISVEDGAGQLVVNASVHL